MASIDSDIAPRRPALLRGLGWMAAHRSITLGGLLIGIIVLAAVFAPLIAPADPYMQDLLATMEPPSLAHPFGTDDNGRDIFARVIFGARISLLEVVLAVGLAVLVGVPLGILSGMSGRYVDQAIMWTMDILFAFPGIVLAILIVSVLGSSLINLLIAIAIFSVPVYARLSRNLTLGLKGMDYVEAAISLGISRRRIMSHYILRNAIGPIIVQSTLTAGTVILSAASLSFLGLGAQPPLPEWGAMMSDGRNYLGLNIWMSLFPGLAIMITVLGFNILGDGLRDLLDPRK
ncbi:D-ala-D-ala transporter subunit [Neorhizobium galegae bv. officinalis bv. officinalis str. HAMBI 1141]|uniref:D-ala-D-ala transporter subunit n=1 Tax=Neorhizobium galegae bv. officinalis bv. officinalis str. HAMBI 1141 TaxID=1028801 RepID=A0A068T7S5_NEOGA|nr:ABC transporter permease [Neorhizobium galegae]CDN54498.1 D-ala-D-ala transporter subunit [Neorhizobium galegae bv. officinalis bv. officinalis str. HAMBI 1141]